MCVQASWLGLVRFGWFRLVGCDRMVGWGSAVGVSWFGLVSLVRMCYSFDRVDLGALVWVA